MALTQQFTNHIQRDMAIAEQILQLDFVLTLLRTEWDQNDMFNLLTDADIQENPNFAHLSKNDIANAFAAFDAVRTALGDFVSGNKVNLVKMKG